MIPAPSPWLITSLVMLAVIVGVAILARVFKLGVWPPVLAFLDGRWAPWCAGTISALVLLVVWGSFNGLPVAHDERAYLLQAEIFARGRWTAPPPPIPEFFEQLHVFIEPAVFAKYPPVHALMLVPGVLLGLPGLMPILLTGVAGGLVFWIARRITNASVAVLTWLLGATASVELFWRARYFSETTSTVEWLLALWALLRWMETRQRRFLIVIAVMLGLGINTRPLTMVMLSVPIAVVVMRQVWRERLWRQLALPVAAGLVAVSIGPLWNYQTLGDPRINPYRRYAETYFPFDLPGFGAADTRSQRPLTPEQEFYRNYAGTMHLHHTPENLPIIFQERLRWLAFWLGDTWRMPLLLFFLIGACQATREERFGLASFALVVVAHLSFAIQPLWTLYYVEVLPVFFLIAAHEVVRLVQRVDAGRLRVPAHPLTASTIAAAALIALAAIWPVTTDLTRMRGAIAEQASFDEQLEATLGSIAEPRAIVFVPFSPRHNYHHGLARNSADLASERIWLVPDRGPDNARLTALAPDRAVYRLQVPALRLVKSPTGVADLSE